MVTVVLVGAGALPDLGAGPCGVFDTIAIVLLAVPTAMLLGLGATRTLRITTHPAIPTTVAVFVP